MLPNVTTSPTSPTSPGARVHGMGEPRPDYPTPPTGGGGWGEVDAAGAREGPNHAQRGEVTADTPCAGCPSPILAGAPRVDDPPFGQHTEAVWHPGCWAAEQRRTEGAA